MYRKSDFLPKSRAANTSHNGLGKNDWGTKKTESISNPN